MIGIVVPSFRCRSYYHVNAVAAAINTMLMRLFFLMSAFQPVCSAAHRLSSPSSQNEFRGLGLVFYRNLLFEVCSVSPSTCRMYILDSNSRANEDVMFRPCPIQFPISQWDCDTMFFTQAWHLRMRVWYLGLDLEQRTKAVITSDFVAKRSKHNEHCTSQAESCGPDCEESTWNTCCPPSVLTCSYATCLDHGFIR